MSIFDIFWLFFMISALQPIIQQRTLEFLRQRKIAEIERKRGSRVIVLVHRQETMRLLGFPIMRYIDVDDSEEVLRAIDLTDNNVPLDIILHTPGGLVLAAMQIARAVDAHPAKVTVLVPHYAMSGGTLIALAADEIRMTKHSVLGPIDPQLSDRSGAAPAASLLKVVEQKPIAEVDDQTLVLADVGRKALDQIREAAKRLLQGKMPEEQMDKVARALSEGRYTHDYPIFADEAKAMGLNVSTEMPEEVLELLALYPQPVRTQRGVEYLPFRRELPDRSAPR
jgi:ClpP class serine protease